MLSIQVHSYNKHYIHLRWILCLILSLFTTLPAISQSRVRHQTSLSDTLLKLKEVTIYSNRMQKKMSPVQILSGKELEKLNVYSVADALRYFSGVQIKDYGGIGGLKTVNIRSMGSHHVGVFYDGIELGNAQNGVVDLGRFSLDNMEVISLYNGQKSAIFQPAKDYSSEKQSEHRGERRFILYHQSVTTLGTSFQRTNKQFHQYGVYVYIRTI